MLKDAWRQLPAGRRRDAVLLLVLVIASGLAEIISIGAILPFLSLLAQFEGGVIPAWLRPWAGWLGLASAGQAIVAATIVLGVVATLAALCRLRLARATQVFVFGAAYDLGVAVFGKALHQPYPYHVDRNSAEIVADINKAQILAAALFLPIVQAMGSAIIAVFIVAMLVAINFKVALFAGAGFALIYGFMVIRTREVLQRNGVVIAEAWAKRLKTVNEALGGIRDITLDQSHAAFIERFSKVERSLSDAQLVSAYQAAAPRFVVEGAGVILLAIIAAALTLSDKGFAGALPILGAMALGAQRLLPLVQSVFAGWAAATSGEEMLADLMGVLKLPDADDRPKDNPWATGATGSAIRLANVSFQYPGSVNPVLGNVSFEISPGERVGLMGPSGSGKTTLMDLILGLHCPTAGEIFIDGIDLQPSNMAAWRATVAHVPQHIFLADASIAENIAFGTPVDAIDMEKVRSAAEQAKLMELVASLPDGLATVVGERGAKLSGGQRQRIGIARALYKQARLLVLDEATSALDKGTEAEVNAAIGALSRDLTILVISHRATSLAVCDRWLSVENGKLHETAFAKIGAAS